MLSSSKNVIRWMIGAILIVDLILVGLSWRLASEPHAPRTELSLLRRQHALLIADIARGQKIRGEMPAVEKECDTFFTQNLQPAGTAYSSLVSDLGDVAHGAGLMTESITFRQRAVDKRGVVEVELSEVVDGDYPSVVRFINGLEHSDHFYVLDGMTLAAGSAGELKLNLQLRTYFRE